LELTCRRILRRQTWPYPAFVQIAAMRWLDGDTWHIYPKIGVSVAGFRWRRLVDAALPVRARRAMRVHHRRRSTLPIARNRT
jgi:hypothetical protein